MVWEITENLIKEFRNEKYNLIIEGTLRTYELPLNEAKRFKENNYSQINLYIIAVKPEKSYLSTLLRYEKMIEHGQNPRMTPKEHHDLVVSNICNNLSKLYEEKAFNNIQLYDRENNLLYDMKKTPNINPKEILENEFKRPWLKEEFENYKKDWENLLSKMENRKANPKEIEEVKKEYENIIKNIVVEKKAGNKNLKMIKIKEWVLQIKIGRLKI